MKPLYNCKVCSKALSGKQRSFCSIMCKNKHFQDYAVLKARAMERKTRLVTTLGGSCNRCGYSTSIDALSFYDMTGLTLNINTNELANNNYRKLEKQVNNAQVLCRNCFEEVQTRQAISHAEFTSASHGKDEILKQVQDDVKNTDTTTRKFTFNLTYCGVKKGQTIVLGVSGGVDSITMLDLFSKSGLKLNIIVAHMNHGVRIEAKDDEIFVNKVAIKYGYKYISKSITKPTSGNLEEVLRNERRKFLYGVAKDNKSNYIALAHNQNDQAETFIMNFIRGSGAAGLGAMKIQDDMIIRPLLNISREEIECYAMAKKLKWHEDKSNLDTTYSRNYIRHNILPLFSKLNPEYLANIYRTAKIQQDLNEYLKQQADEIISRIVIPGRKPGIQTIKIDSWLATRNDKVVWFEIFGKMYEKAKGDRKNLALTNLFELEKLISDSKGTKSIDLPDEVIAVRTYKKLDFVPKKEHNNTSAIKPVSIDKLSEFNNGFVVEFLKPSKQILDNFTLLIDKKQAASLSVRSVSQGDKIAKRGVSGDKKLQDLFVDAKISRDKRQKWPIIINKNNKIIWVPGLAIDRELPEKPKNPILIKICEVTDEKE